MKLNWDNLTKEERAEYMRLQMSPSYGANSSYYPEDVSDCGACGQPTMRASWCKRCLNRYNELDGKLRGSWGNEVESDIEL